MKKIFFILIIILISSCRCETNFEVVYENEISNIVKVNSNIWQSRYEYLNIDLTVDRIDSLLIKDIKIIPTTENGKFPTFDHCQMITSFVIKNDKKISNEFKEIYTEKSFKNFPELIRRTNHQNEKVFYSFSYTNKVKINIQKYSANIKIILADEKNKDEITLEKKVQFFGERECYFSAH